MVIIIVFIALVVATIATIQLLGSYEEIPVLSCLLVLFGLAMMVRGSNYSAAAAFIAAPLPVIRIKQQQKARIWHDLQGTEAQGEWRCPHYYDPLDWDDTVQWRQEWWDS